MQKPACKARLTSQNKTLQTREPNPYFHQHPFIDNRTIVVERTTEAIPNNIMVFKTSKRTKVETVLA